MLFTILPAVSPIRTFLNKPITIRLNPSFKLLISRIRSHLICGNSLEARSIGPATTVGKNEANTANSIKVYFSEIFS